MKKIDPEIFRNFVFGAEDSLVSTLGVLFGVTALSTFTKEQILATGLITIIVESSSMGAGSFLSESSTNELEKKNSLRPKQDGVVMATAYFFAGFIPLFPYAFFPIESARYISVGVTLIALFLLGYIPAKRAKSGIKMALVAGFAALVGLAVAFLFRV